MIQKEAYTIPELKRKYQEKLAERDAEIARLKKQAQTDPLTGAYNRAGLTEVLSAEIKEAETKGHPLSLVYVDLNKFKQINDNLGHDVGDEVLKQFSSIVQENMRDSDLVSYLESPELVRNGGDEFLFVLPCTDKNGAEYFCKKIEKVTYPSLNDLLDKKSEGKDHPGFSFSYGITQYDSKVNSSGNLSTEKVIEELLKSSDKQMYESKRKKTS